LAALGAELEAERLPEAEARKGIGAPPAPQDPGGAAGAEEAIGAAEEPNQGEAPPLEAESMPDGLEGEELLALVEWARSFPSELLGVKPRPLSPAVRSVLRPVADRAAQDPALGGSQLSPRSASYVLGFATLVLVVQSIREARQDAQKGNGKTQGGSAQGAGDGGFPPPFRRTS